MKISKTIISNILINYFSPLDQQKLIQCNKFFNKQISKAINNLLRCFRNLNPWFNQVEDIEAQMLLIFNAHMIHYLISALKIKDMTQFDEFVFNSQDSLLIHDFDRRSYLEPEEEFEPEFEDQYEMIQYYNVMLHDKYDIDFSNGTQIGYQHQTELEDQDDSQYFEEKQKAFELFMQYFCKLKIVESYMRNYILKLLKLFDPEFDSNLNIVTITYKCLLKSNIEINIFLARKIANYQNQFEIFTVNEQSEIQFELLEYQSLNLISQLDQFDLKQISNIPLIFTIFNDMKNKQNIDQLKFILRYQYYNETYGLKFPTIIKQITEILQYSINEKYIEKFVEIVEEKEEFSGFSVVQEFIKITVRQDFFNDDQDEQLDLYGSEDSFDSQIKEEQKFQDKQINDIKIHLFQGDQAIACHFNETYNLYIHENSLEESQGQIGFRSLKTQSKLCFDLYDRNYDGIYVNMRCGPQTQPYQCLYCVIEKLNIQAIILIDIDAKDQQLQDLLLDMLFKKEYTSKNIIQSVTNNQNIGNIFEIKRQTRIIFFNVSDDNHLYQHNEKLNTHMITTKTMINRIQNTFKNNVEYYPNDTSIKYEVNVMRLQEKKWKDILQVDGIKYNEWVKNNTRIKKSKIIQYFFENEPKTFQNQLKMNDDNQSTQKFDDYAKYINTNYVKYVN